ncbi:LOW QUALITY PROTEIN: uncharacterized protein ACIB01_019838 [Guaruba guarouba]
MTSQVDDVHDICDQIVLNDSTVPGQPEVLQDAVLQVSDGSYYIHVVIASKALWSEENTHTQLKLSSLICRIIVLQKYTVCFQEEARLEDCEFYLRAQKFIVLPMERQRLESSSGNKEPFVMQKIKEVWLRSLALKNAPSSGQSISQFIDAIGQSQLEVLKENAEECLDLWMPNVMPVMVKDKVPVTQWKAECKEEQDEDTFMVLANILVVPPEEEAVAYDASKAETSEASPGESADGRMGPGDLSVISQPNQEVLAWSGLWNTRIPRPALSRQGMVPFLQPPGAEELQFIVLGWACVTSLGLVSPSSAAEGPAGAHTQFFVATTGLEVGQNQLSFPKSTLGFIIVAAESMALSESLEGFMNKPDRLPPISLTLSCSDGESPCHPACLAGRKQHLSSHWRRSFNKTLHRRPSKVWLLTATPRTRWKCVDRTLLRACHQESRCRPLSLLCNYGNTNVVETSTTQEPSAVEAHRFQGALRPPQHLAFPILPSSQLQALPEGMPHREQADSSVPAFLLDMLGHGQAHARTPGGDAVGAKWKLLAGDGQTLPAHHGQLHPQGALWGKGREMGQRLEPMMSGPSSWLEQHRALQLYEKKPLQYRYEAPSPELCEQIRSVRISKVMLKWACWILMDREVDP